MGQVVDTGSRGGGASWLRAAVLIMALAVLIVAQTYLDARRLQPIQGKSLFVVGLCLASVALLIRKEDPHFTWAFALKKQTLPVTPVLMRVFPLFGLSVALAAVAAAYAGRREPSPDALAVWLLSVVLFVAGLLFYYRPWRILRSPSLAVGQPSRTRSIELVLLALVVALAICLRVVDLNGIPPYVNVDEALDGVEARYVRDGTIHAFFENTYADQTRAAFVPAALFLKLTGDELLSLRLSNVITSLLTLPFIYLLARMFVGRASALLAVFLLAVAAMDLNFTRMGIMNIQAAPLGAATMYLFARALRGHRLSAWACGMVGGLCVYAYFPNRVIPFVIGVVLLLMMVKDRHNWAAYVRVGLVILGAALLVAAPQLGYYVSHLQALVGHASWYNWLANPGVGVPGGANLTRWAVFLRQLDQTFWGFTYYWDNTFHFPHGAKILDSVTGILFFLGLVVSLRSWRQPQFLVLCVWFLVSAFVIGVLATGTPVSTRLVGIVPAICLLAAIGVEGIWNTVQGHGRALRGATALGVFVLVPVSVLASNQNVYFQGIVQSYSYDYATEAGLYLQKNYGQVTGYILGAALDPHHSAISFLAPDSAYPMVLWEDYLPLRQPVKGDAVYIATDYYVPALDYVREYYPNGTLEEVKKPDNTVVMAFYRVPRSDILAQQELPGAYRSLESGATADRKDANIDFNWDQDRPAGITGEFTVAWVGSLYAPDSAIYHLRLEGNGNAALSLDGKALFGDAAPGLPADAQRDLARGWHTLRLDYKADGGQLKLLWAHGDEQLKAIGPEFFGTSGVVHGLSATYYAGTDTSGAPAMRVIEPALFNGSNAFVDKNGWKPYVVTWKGALAAETAGEYKFAARAVDGDLELRIDGQPVLTVPAGTQERKEATVQLASGQHNVDMTWRNPTGRTEALQVWWAPPGSSTLSPLPARVLSPAP